MFDRAQQLLPGGVGANSRGVLAGFRPHPFYMRRGTGPYLEDVDGNQYIDYVSSFGALLLGHRPQPVLRGVRQTLDEVGSMLGACHELEIQAAEAAVAAVPCWKQVRFANSGSEAVMAALRLARSYTGRQHILRFEGHYHGQTDTIHFSSKPPVQKAGLEAKPLPVPGTEGMPSVLADTLIVRPWNQVEVLEQTFAEYGKTIAGVICEPVMANAAVIEPQPGFLQLLRKLTTQYNCVLIFDEVKTGFRLALGGAQEYYGVIPDLSLAAKAMGGGFPVAAVGGRTEIMSLIASNRVTQSATYHTNPLVMAACLATLSELAHPDFYTRLNAHAGDLRSGLQDAANQAGVPVVVQGIGSLLQVIFADQPVKNYRELVQTMHSDMYTQFWQEMLQRGIYFHPSPLEIWCVSSAHGTEEVEQTIKAAKEAFRALKAD